VGKKTGRNPVDRGKIGTKKSILTDGEGIPLALAIHPSNEHDSTTIDELLDGCCLYYLPKESVIYFDKGYDSEHLREGFSLLEIKVVIPRRHKRPGRPPKVGQKRWQVERTFSWLNRFKQVKTRTAKKGENFIAIIQFAASWITLNKVLG
jgi:putative transposase